MNRHFASKADTDLNIGVRKFLIILQRGSPPAIVISAPQNRERYNVSNLLNSSVQIMLFFYNRLTAYNLFNGFYMAKKVKCIRLFYVAGVLAS
jgi:hypothetical protein